MKLHELTREAAGLEPAPLPVPDIRVSAPDPNNPTREQVIKALKSVYRQLLSGKTVNQAALAKGMIAPAILYLESLD
jgi:hypothetical protein